MFNDDFFDDRPDLGAANRRIVEVLNENFLMDALAGIINGTTDIKAVLMQLGNLLHGWGLTEAVADVTLLTDAINKSPALRKEIEAHGLRFSMPTPEQARGSDKFVFDEAAP